VTPLDWTIIIVYMLGMIGMSVYLGRGQTSQDDYYVGSRNIPWWAVGISTMATQTSAISFISIPAFVALKPGGGMTWLQYELAVPLAMILVMAFLIPFFRSLELISVYEYLEKRFSRGVRLLVSAVFLISRGLATGVGVYASGIVLSVCLGIPLWSTILIIGVVTIIYDTIGGMSAVIYSDVIQMFVLVGGIITCIVYASASVGGFENIFAALPDSRAQAFEFSSGLGDGGNVPLWAFLFGGFFLYSSYYGTDQSQVQRGLSASSVDESKWALILNGLARFPLTLLYILMGVAVYAVYQNSPELAAAIPAERPDYLVPQYILLYLPSGFRALLFAALLAAAMSSLDSALNSLSASTMRDFLENKLDGSSNFLFASKVTTVIWGIFVTGFAFLVGNISDTVIEAINKIGSAFYGPILAAFLAGILTKRTTSMGIACGIIAGVGVNIVLWLGFPGIHWMWWNLFGCVITSGFALLFFTQRSNDAAESDISRYVLNWSKIKENEQKWTPVYGMLVGYAVLMILIMVWIQNAF